MATGLINTFSYPELTKSRYSVIPDKPFIIRSGKRVLPVYDVGSKQYVEISTDAKTTSLDWRFFGTKAYILPTGTWEVLKQKRRCKAIYIPLDNPIPEQYRKASLIGFVAASVDVLAVSIHTGAPIPKKPRRTNKKSANLGYTASAVINYGSPSTQINMGTHGAYASIPAHCNTTIRKSDGYVVYSTDTTNKQIKKSLSFSSVSSPGKSYITTIYVDGSVSCNCPRWTRKVPRSCKHLIDDRTINEIKK